SLDKDIVHAMTDQVVANGVVNPGKERNSKLGPYSISRRYEDGLAHPAEVSAKHAAEGPDLGHHIGSESRSGKLLDVLFGAIGGVYVDACIAIADFICH